MDKRPSIPPLGVLVELMLAQSLEFAHFFIAPDGRVSDWFQGAEHIFGFSAGEMVGTPVDRLFTRDDLARGAHRYELELARSTGRSEDDRWHVRKDGTMFWGSGIMQALRGADGALVGYAKIVRNRTDLKTQTEALERERDSVSQREEQERHFLATLGHELRNPLGPITNAVSLLRHPQASPHMTEQALRVLDRQTQVLSRLVEDVMDLTRAATGKVDLKRRVADLREVVDAAVQSVRGAAEARRQDLRTLYIEGPVPVSVDSDRLHQVFVNLLGNAIKYTHETGRIVGSVTIEGGEAVARIEDNGMGMTAEVLPTVFEIFTQDMGLRDAQAGGVGVGLAVVRQLVQAHGGTVQARSDGRGKGSVFTVRLPLHAAAQS